MYKADIFRLFILYFEGGYYIDADMEPRTSLNNIIEHYKDITFTSVIDISGRNIFQSFLGATKFNPIILQSLKIFEHHYRNQLSMPENAGTVFLADALRDFTKEDSLQKIQKQQHYQSQTIQLFNEKIYDGEDAEMLLPKKESLLTQFAVYDNKTKQFAFWSRFDGYQNEVIRQRYASLVAILSFLLILMMIIIIILLSIIFKFKSAPIERTSKLIQKQRLNIASMTNTLMSKIRKPRPKTLLDKEIRSHTI